MKSKILWKLRDIWHLPQMMVKIHNPKLIWKFLAVQPFCCKGDKDCWQTKFCNWLEEKAREREF